MRRTWFVLASILAWASVVYSAPSKYMVTQDTMATSDTTLFKVYGRAEVDSLTLYGAPTVPAGVRFTAGAVDVDTLVGNVRTTGTVTVPAGVSLIAASGDIDTLAGGTLVPAGVRLTAAAIDVDTLVGNVRTTGSLTVPAGQTATIANGDIDTLTSVNSADINGGTVDGAVIGGASAAAGTFTALTANGKLTAGDAASDTFQALGRVLLPYGTAALPTLGATSDPNTGLNYWGGDSLSVSAGGVTRQKWFYNANMPTAISDVRLRSSTFVSHITYPDYGLAIGVDNTSGYIQGTDVGGVTAANLRLQPFGGTVISAGDVLPSTDGGPNLGSVAATWDTLFARGIITDGNVGIGGTMSLNHGSDTAPAAQLLFTPAGYSGQYPHTISTLHSAAVTANKMVFAIATGAASSIDALTLTGGAQVLIGTQTASINAAGPSLLIAQGGADDDAQEWTSTDVSQPATGYRPAATYGLLSKYGATEGGLNIVGLNDADATLGANALALTAISGDALVDSTDTSSSTAVMSFAALTTDGGTSTAVLSAAENGWVWLNGATAVMLLKGGGVLHLTNATPVALDGEPDTHLIRALERQRSAGVLMSKWDGLVKENAEDLKRVGVLSSDGSMIAVQPLLSLYGGGIWRVQTDVYDLDERVSALESGAVLTKTNPTWGDVASLIWRML